MVLLVGCSHTNELPKDTEISFSSVGEFTELKQNENLTDEPDVYKRHRLDMAKWVYMFTEGDASMRNTLGGKGANLAEMTKLGLPVPQGFTITTDACTQYYEDGRKINDEIMEQIMDAIVKMLSLIHI